MAMTYPKVICEGESDRHPLLMERPVGTLNHGHVIDIPPHGDNASSSTPNDEIRSSHEQHNRPALSTSHSESALPLPSGTPSSRSSSFIRRTDNYGRRHRSPLNSGLWISIELIIAVSQIVASIIVLSLSRNERPQTPLFVWVVGYACGCFSTLPLLYWRYLTRNRVPQQDSANSDSVQENIPMETSYTVLSTPQTSEEEEGHTTTSNWDRSTNLRNSRLGTFVDHFKMALDCFFAVWFIVGNVWIFGGHSSFSEAPNLYRLCIVFLTFSCIGYAMPFIFCATICCCLPCIISMLGYREDQYHNRGATSETIGSLPTHKFKAKRQERGKDDGDVESDDSCGGGIIFAGTEKEKVVSAEDAVCCICLAKYIDNDDLRELPCSHFFHVECVDKWLKINAMCPLCKHEVGEDNSRLSVESSDTRQAEQRVQSGEAVGIGYGMV